MHQAIERRSPAPGMVVAVGLPLVLLGVAYLLWMASDRLIRIGPFDRATFGWAFVIPIWLATPVVTGFAWWRMPTPLVVRAAAVIVVSVTAVAAWKLWNAIATPDCGDLGTVLAPSALIAPSVMFGLALGGGVVASGLITRAALLRGARARAIAVGLIASVVASLISAIVLVALLGGRNCNRPTFL